MSAITILLANPHPIVRSNLRALLEREFDFHVVAEAANGREALLLTEYKRPNIAVLDVSLPLLAGIETARSIVKLRTSTKIIVHGTHGDEEYVSAAFDAGARGYVAADSADADLCRAVRVVARTGRYISPSISVPLIQQWCAEQTPPVRIDAAQARAYSLLAAGYEADEIRYNALLIPLPHPIARSIRENQLSR